MISCKDLRFKYKLQQIINDISLKFESGHLYGIIGPNGSGKTTLIKLLSGILKQNYGQIYIDDINIKNFTIREIAKHLAMVNQTNYIEFDYKVREIIKMGRYAHINRFSVESEEDKKIVDEVIEQLGLKKLEKRSFNQLSGGEQQKVIIARAIAQKTKILLLDEPTTHLDINFTLEFMKLFKDYVEKGLIVIIVLHDLNIAAQYCDKLILINEGRVVDFGDAKSVLTKDNIHNVYGIDVMIRENQYTNSVYIIPFNNINLKSEEITKKTMDNRLKVHIISGGGSMVNFLSKLRNFNVSVGVVNIFDDDLKLAEDFGFKTITEGPFSPISEKSYEELIEKLKEVDIIILANIPFGKGNLRNLEALTNIDNKIIVIEKNTIEERDYTNGIATSIYNQLIKKKSVKVINNIEELIPTIQKEIGE
ncbi:MAG: ABC transporter ATP-binding protein [Candidatus Odinarchaeota archaeon]